MSDTNEIVTDALNYDVDEINFDQRNDRLVLKSLLTWVSLRFATVQGRKFQGSDLRNFQQIQLIEKFEKIAVVSKRDAWIIEKNAALFTKVAQDFMKEFLSEELYASYGCSVFMVDRKSRIANVALMPSKRSVAFQEVAPCSMYIMDNKEVVEEYKEKDKLIREHHVDIIPLLKIMSKNMLTSEQNLLINKLYNKYKDDNEVIEMRSKVEKYRAQEEENVEMIMRAINVEGARSTLTKLAVVIHAVVKASYKNGYHLISKIKFDRSGGATPVADFERGFRVGVVETLEPLQDILKPLLPTDIKIKVHENIIMFTTGNIDLENNADVACSTIIDILDEKVLDHMFNNHVAPVADINDVNRIMNGVLFEKYKGEYF